MSSPIVVIESDDWGSIRIPDIKTHSELKKKNIDVISNSFNRYDTLESEEDFHLMEGILNQIYEDTGKKVILTANIVMANPDFEKIQTGNFELFYFEDFRKTYQNYGYNDCWTKFHKLINDGYFYPQFHAREHVNVLKWLGLLKENNTELRTSFEHQVFSNDFISKEGKKENLMAAYWYQNDFEKTFIELSIVEGLDMFKQVFSFKSKSTIAPVGIWDYTHEKIFAGKGINSFQSFIIQKIPNGNTLANSFRYMGQKNDLGQSYFPRNVYFEPSTDQNRDWVNTAFNQIGRAFFFKKPAIISTHRLNFVGGLDSELRDQNIKKFDVLIRKLITRWPNVQFISSDKLLVLV